MQGMVAGEGEERTSIGASQATIIYSHPLQSCNLDTLQKLTIIKMCRLPLVVPDITATFAEEPRKRTLGLGVLANA